jgi:arginase
MAGVDIGSGGIAGRTFESTYREFGISVRDLGDLRLERPQSVPEADEKLKYVREISNACEQLSG